MALKIKPPKPPQETASANSRSSSPVAPAYSPITPKVQPALPVAVPHQDVSQRPQPPPPPPSHSAPTGPVMEPPASPRTIPPNGNSVPHDTQRSSPGAPPPPPAILETEYIPQPPSQPFSSKDSPDAIALRAAISSLQFQKQKATEDIGVLSAGKAQALADPHRFKRDLIAGKLKEKKPDFGGIRALLDAPSDEDDEDDEVVLGAQESEPDAPAPAPEIPDSQPSRPTSGQFQTAAAACSSSESSPKPFPPIPGPQNVVRMPPINWEKYHIVGEPLDIMHEQQRRWPGSAPGQGIERGQEHAVAAPYSPFYDRLGPRSADGDRGRAGPAPSATGTVRPAYV